MTRLKNNSKLILIICFFSAFVLLPQINQHAIVAGGDSSFHWNRIYDAMMQIKNGNFQYFVSMYGFSQSGRIVNALYGPYIAYLNGFLLLIAGSWFKYQLLSDWFVNVIASFSMMYLLRKNNVSRHYSLLISLLFITTYSISTWTLNQQFMAWGTAIMPLGIAAGTRMIRNLSNQISVFELTMGVTLIIQTHVLSALFLISILAVFFTVGFIKSNNRLKMLRDLLISILFTLVLTCNIWGSFLEIYGTNVVLAPFHNAVPLTNGVVNFTLENSQLTSIFVIVLAIQISLLFMHYKKLPISNKLSTILGIIFLCLSTQLVPWNKVFNLVPAISVIQFPYRFLGPALILILLGLGMSLMSLSQYSIDNLDIKSLLLLICLLVSTFSLLGQVQNKSAAWSTNDVLSSRYNVKQKAYGDDLRNMFASRDTGTVLKNVWKPAPDYLPSNSKNNRKTSLLYDDYSKQIVTNNTFSKSVKKGKLFISWESKSTKPLLLNVVKYKHTNIVLNGEKLLEGEYKLTDIGAVIIHPKHGNNLLVLSYKPSSWFKGMIIVSIVSLIGFVILIGIVRFKTNRFKS